MLDETFNSEKKRKNWIKIWLGDAYFKLSIGKNEEHFSLFFWSLVIVSNDTFYLLPKILPILHDYSDLREI